ncbi:MAG: DUF2849 domain-containing protein [Filomicrobium sp.]
MPSIITANRLQDGIVVYLAKDGGWRTDLSAAHIAEDKDQLAALEVIASKAAGDQLIVGAYPMDVEISQGTPAPKSVREKIRAAHRPTIAAVNEAR